MKRNELLTLIGQACHQVLYEKDNTMKARLYRELEALVSSYLDGDYDDRGPPREEDTMTIIELRPGPPTKSYKVYVCVDNEWVTNGLRFSTEAEALRYAEDLSARWTKVSTYDVQPSSDEPNAQMLRFGKHAKIDDRRDV